MSDHSSVKMLITSPFTPEKVKSLQRLTVYYMHCIPALKLEPESLRHTIVSSRQSYILFIILTFA